MPKARRAVPPRLHDLEAEVMGEVWRLEEANVRQVLEALNSGPKQRAYTTVMTIMSRLHDKGLLLRRREGKADVYRPSMTRAEYDNARAEGEVAALVEDYGDFALVHFARQMDTLDPKRVAKLRRLARDSG